MQQSVLRRAAYIGIWILVSFAFSGLLYFSNTATLRRERTIGWREVLAWQAIIYGWAILFPFIHLFIRKFPFERRNWLLASIAYCFAAFLFVFAHTVLYAGFYEIIHGTFFQTENAPRRIRFLFLRNWVLDSSMYWMIFSLIFGYDYYRRFQEEQIKSSELRTQLANSQLQTLKMQLHPHFLFNTLNSISALIHEDARAADKMVARLGDFLRLTLENSGEQEVPLKKEIDFLNRYLEIEGIRFGDRLSVKIDIEPETLSASVPNLILQPIIENAVRHGISRQIEPGLISITARRNGEMLFIQIENSGPRLNFVAKESNNGKGGIGLSNTRARLFHHYGENHYLSISNAEPNGVQVTLEIPFEIGSTEPAKQENGNEKFANH